MDEKEIERKLLARGPSISMSIFAGLPDVVVERYSDQIVFGLYAGLRLTAAELAQLFEREMAERDGRVLNLLAAIRYHVPDIEFTREISRELNQVLTELGHDFAKPTEPAG